MKRLVFVMLSALVFVLVSCSTPVNTDSGKEEQTVTPATNNGGNNGGSSSTPAETINWVEVVADEESTSGFAYFFIDQRVANPVADLVAEKKIKLVLVSTKSNIRADRYFGLKDDKAERINVYKVFVNGDIRLNEIFLTDNALVYNSAAIENDGFRFHITKNGNVWKMNIVVTTSLAENNGAIRYFNQYYE